VFTDLTDFLHGCSVETDNLSSQRRNCYRNFSGWAQNNNIIVYLDCRGVAR
jgi:hypothetical protein